MAVKDFIKQEIEVMVNVYVCNAEGKAYNARRLPQKIANAMVIGSDTYINEAGAETIYIWID